MVDKTSISVVRQHQVARGWTVFLSTHSPCPVSCSSTQGMGEGPAGLKVAQLPPGCTGITSPAGGSGPSSAGIWSSRSQGLRTVALTWIMIPLALYSACSALENVHTKAWSRKEKHLRTRAGFLHQNQLTQISKGTARSLPLYLKM